MLREITFALSVVLVSQVSAIECDTNISERPKDAPVISKVAHDTNWHEQSLHGISKPYPYSFSFIKNQGNWYTPFNKAGMLGPYDIRGWHK